jgi:transposase
VAPFNCDSGTLRGQRKIDGGRPRLRRVLYIAPIATVRCNPVLKPFYLHLRVAGKPAKVAIVAAAHKLLTILNAILKTKTPWRATMSRMKQKALSDPPSQLTLEGGLDSP